MDAADLWAAALAASESPSPGGASPCCSPEGSAVFSLNSTRAGGTLWPIREAVDANAGGATMTKSQTDAKSSGGKMLAFHESSAATDSHVLGPCSPSKGSPSKGQLWAQLDDLESYFQDLASKKLAPCPGEGTHIEDGDLPRTCGATSTRSLLHAPEKDGDLPRSLLHAPEKERTSRTEKDRTLILGSDVEDSAELLGNPSGKTPPRSRRRNLGSKAPARVQVQTNIHRRARAQSATVGGIGGFGKGAKASSGTNLEVWCDEEFINNVRAEGPSKALAMQAWKPLALAASMDEKTKTKPSAAEPEIAKHSSPFRDASNLTHLSGRKLSGSVLQQRQLGKEAAACTSGAADEAIEARFSLGIALNTQKLPAASVPGLALRLPEVFDLAREDSSPGKQLSYLNSARSGVLNSARSVEARDWNGDAVRPEAAFGATTAAAAAASDKLTALRNRVASMVAKASPSRKTCRDTSVSSPCRGKRASETQAGARTRGTSRSPSCSFSEEVIERFPSVSPISRGAGDDCLIGGVRRSQTPGSENEAVERFYAKQGSTDDETSSSSSDEESDGGCARWAEAAAAASVAPRKRRSIGPTSLRRSSRFEDQLQSNRRLQAQPLSRHQPCLSTSPPPLPPPPPLFASDIRAPSWDARQLLFVDVPKGQPQHEKEAVARPKDVAAGAGVARHVHFSGIESTPPAGLDRALNIPLPVARSLESKTARVPAEPCASPAGTWPQTTLLATLAAGLGGALESLVSMATPHGESEEAEEAEEADEVGANAPVDSVVDAGVHSAEVSLTVPMERLAPSSLAPALSANPSAGLRAPAPLRPVFLPPARLGALPPTPRCGGLDRPAGLGLPQAFPPQTLLPTQSFGSALSQAPSFGTSMASGDGGWRQIGGGTHRASSTAPRFGPK